MLFPKKGPQDDDWKAVESWRFRANSNLSSRTYRKERDAQAIGSADQSSRKQLF
jgi:hypothetical protein